MGHSSSHPEYLEEGRADHAGVFIIEYKVGGEGYT